MGAKENSNSKSSDYSFASFLNEKNGIPLNSLDNEAEREAR